MSTSENTADTPPAKPQLPDVLAKRYASTGMVGIWTPENTQLLYRKLWIAVLRAQKDLGLKISGKEISDGDIAAYESVMHEIDLASITKRERKTRHDIKAAVEEFNHLAGRQLIHMGMTSRDLTDNTEQLQILMALKLIRDRTVTVLHRLGVRAEEFKTLDITGRTHNVPAQATTLGHRFAGWAEELLHAFEALERLIATYPLRGMKGALGTQQDMIDLLGGAEKAAGLDERIMEHLEFTHSLDCIGQVYPRSLDSEVLSHLVQLAAGPTNMAITIRLMSGHGLAGEGFAPGQTGSSAMPHKMNARSCERICGMLSILKGFHVMTQNLVGNQWNEGDVSCSVVRRVAIPGGFMALDGLFETLLTILNEFGVFPGMIEHELKQQLPFLSTTRLLMAAVEKGTGREDAHRIVKKHSTFAIENMRGGGPNTLIDSLGADEEFPLTREEIVGLVSEPVHGAAEQQVDRVVTRIAGVTRKYPDAVHYEPEPIL